MSQGRIADIEILRGFAVLFVVLHHAHGNLISWSSPGLDLLSAYFAGGFGVDLFLAISGFVIARDLLPRLSACTNAGAAWRNTLAFWVRRAWRLLPSAWFWLAVLLLEVLFFNSSGVFGSVQANIDATLAAVVQLANLRFAQTFGSSEYGASFVYWSLSLEEQFYLLLPILVLVSRRFLPYVLIVLVVLQLFATRNLLTVMFRSDALMLGVLLAIWSRTAFYQRMRPQLLMRLPGLGTLTLMGLSLLMGAIWSDALDVGLYKFSLIAVGSALLAWIASYDGNVLLPRGRFRSLMLWVGSRSYAIYLIHIPAFFTVREIGFRLFPGVVPDDRFFYFFVLGAALLIIVLSELNFRWLETPLRLRGAVIAQRLAGEKATPPAESKVVPQLGGSHVQQSVHEAGPVGPA
jgi:peptidoglycan/LPS O-acetylase OafA/YrhL